MNVDYVIKAKSKTDADQLVQSLTNSGYVVGVKRVERDLYSHPYPYWAITIYKDGGEQG